MDRIKKKLLQIPIPAAFVLCGMAALLCALSLTRATMWFAQKNKGEIAAGYVELAAIPSQEALSEQEQQPDSSMTEPEAGPSREALPEDDASTRDAEQEMEMVPLEEASIAELGLIPFEEALLPEEERKRYDFYESLDNMAAILWYSLCLCLFSLVFYLWKMKKPLQILNQAARKIAENDLNFQIDYQGTDELGRLCQAFESMRGELEQNNWKMWNAVEERKRLNAAFAHDLRTPLTVLQGHTDLLLDTLTAGQQDADPEILSDLQAISNQVTRMNSYLDTMNSLRRLEDYAPCLRAVSAWRPQSASSCRSRNCGWTGRPSPRFMRTSSPTLPVTQGSASVSGFTESRTFWFSRWRTTAWGLRRKTCRMPLPLTTEGTGESPRPRLTSAWGCISAACWPGSWAAGCSWPMARRAAHGSL